MYRMVKSIMITPDGKYHEVSQEEETAAMRGRRYIGYGLQVPKTWEHKKLRLTVTMLDQFTPEDPPNSWATVLFRKLYSNGGGVDDEIPGLVFISNETDNEVIDFTMEDFVYIWTRVILPKELVFEYLCYVTYM